MHIVRYRHYPQSDLSAALDRLTNMRAEMDRVFESTVGSFSRSPAPLSRWNPAVNVYQDKDRFTVVVELPGLKKEEIEISLHDDTLTIAGERKREESSAQEFLLDARHFGSDNIANIRGFYIRRRRHVMRLAIVLVRNHRLILWRLGKNIHRFLQIPAPRR